MGELISAMIALNFNNLNHRWWQMAVLSVERRGILPRIAGMLENRLKVLVLINPSTVDLGIHRGITTITAAMLVQEEGQRYLRGSLL